MNNKNTEVEETVEEIVEEVVEEKVKNKKMKKKDELTMLREENEGLKMIADKLKNDYFKAYADAENTRKRLERDYELSMKYRIQSFAGSILPALDNLERALNQETNDETISFREGVQMIYDQILASLEAEGVTPIDALNKEFDPNIHQALLVEEVEGVEPNIIVEELQKGYMIKDRVLRASLVKVSQ